MKISDSKFQAIKAAAEAQPDRELNRDEVKALADSLGLSELTVREKLWNLESGKLRSLPAPVAWENEKAIGIDLEAEFTVDPTIARTANLKPVRARLFFPKSQVKDGRVPAWLFAAKRREAEARLPAGYEII